MQLDERAAAWSGRWRPARGRRWAPRRPASAGPRRRDRPPATSRTGYSRRIDSSRSAPKRKTERAKQEISRPWRRVSQSTVASVPASKEPATQHDLRRVAGDGGLQRVVDGGQRGGVHAGDRSGGAEGVGQLGVGDVGGDADDDGAAGLLVEGQQVEAGDLALADEAEARLAELAGEGLPGGADEREHLLAVGAHFGDKTARRRCHQRLGRLVDAQHGLCPPRTRGRVRGLSAESPGT